MTKAVVNLFWLLSYLLQFEVAQARLRIVYGVESILESLGYSLARWANAGWDAVVKADAAGTLFGIKIVQDRWKWPCCSFEMIRRQRE
jgi:peptide chain release factor 3